MATPSPLSSDADRISRVVFEYAARISSEQDTDSLLRLNAGLARDLVAADRCSIWLLDSQKNELWTKVAHGIDELRVPAGHGLVGACVSQNETVLVNDASTDERFLNRVDKGSGYVTQSVVVLPLRGSSGKVIGALQALNKPGGFSPSDVELLGLAAAYSASAIDAQRLRQEAEAARLFYRELEIARDVQARLFPQNPPKVDGLEYAAYCRPAKFVGGDYYDVIPVTGALLAFTLGDVSGKGIAAAVLMASIQASLRSHMVRAPQSLAVLMNDFNRSVFSSSSSDRYSTLFCALMDVPRRRLTYVNAGHIPPVLIRAGSDQVERLQAGGLPVGLLDIVRYAEDTVELGSGDLLVLYSDGIGEATNINDDIWDEAEVERIALANRAKPVEEIVKLLVEAADVFTGAAEQHDDMTLMVLRVV
jgi:phosphoserine phosphatase RsbU/P